MFVRHDAPYSKQQYYEDSLLTKPTTSQSVLDNAAASFATPFALAVDVENMFSEKPQGNPLRDAIEGVDIMNQTPGMGWGQKSANWLAGMVGFGLNPINWGFGRLGGLGAEALVGGAAKVAPDAVNVFMRTPIKDLVGENVGKYIPNVGKNAEIPLTTAIFGAKSAETFGTFAGAGVPQAVFDNYNADTKHINWGGVAKDMSVMGAFGLAIGSVPYAWGVLRGRVNRSMGNAPNSELTLADYQKAFEDGTISKQELDWITDYHTKPLETPDLQTRATQILADDGHPVNVADHVVPFDIMKPEQVDNLRNAMTDQALSDVPEQYKGSLSDFIVHNSIDELRENPKGLEGVRGYVDFINQKLKDKDTKLAEADKILDDHLMNSVKDFMPFSQKEMFKSMKQMGFEASHIKNIPITVPENIYKHIKAEGDIELLESENKKLLKQNQKARNPKYTKLIAENEKRIKALTTNKNDYISRMNRSEEAKGDVKDWEERIEFYKSQNEKYREKDKLITSGKRYLNKIASNEEKIKNIKEALPKILTPKEELAHLRESLLGGKELPKNWERSRDYHRLNDLAHVWHNAQSLLDRVHLEAQYERQEAFKNLAQETLNLVDSDVTRFGNRGDVVNYMKSRIQSKVRREPIEGAEIKAAQENELPANHDEIMKEQDNMVDQRKADKLTEEYKASSEKYKEFNSSQNVFNSLIKCVLGAMNG